MEQDHCHHAFKEQASRVGTNVQGLARLRTQRHRNNRAAAEGRGKEKAIGICLYERCQCRERSDETALVVGGLRLDESVLTHSPHQNKSHTSNTSLTQPPLPQKQGDAEVKILNYGQQSNGLVAAHVAKIGLITDPRKDTILKTIGSNVLGTVVGIGTVDIDVISVALLDQVVNGFEKETLVHADVVRIGRKVMEGMKERGTGA